MITLRPNTTLDLVDSNDQLLSLREAILAANNDRGNQYIIELQPSQVYRLSLDGSDEDLGLLGDLDLYDQITIKTPNGRAATIDAGGFSSEAPDRVFHIHGNANVVLENIVITNGSAQGIPGEPMSRGGGILADNSADVTISNSLIIRNTAFDDGGGIYGGTNTIVNSTITENMAGDDGGGGIGADENTFNTITSSIISNNSAGDKGGGIFSGVNVIIDSTIINNNSDDDGGGIYGGTNTIINSTISNNIASDDGGGIHNGNNKIINSTISSNKANDNGGGLFLANGTHELFNVTIAKNIADADTIPSPEIGTGGGIRVLRDAQVFLNNSIVGGNIRGLENDAIGAVLSDISGTVQGDNFNIVSTGQGVDGLGQTDIVATPRLAPLGNYGGPTQTHILYESSPAVDAGNNAFADSPVDQRGPGFPRIQNGIVNIGSVEGTIPDILDGKIYRFRNTDVPSAYLYVAEQERQNVLQNFPQFVEEGFAFEAAVAPNDDLISIYRFQNESLPGSYLYVAEAERQNILNNRPEWTEEGFAFAVYESGSFNGDQFYRFQSLNLPGTYLFVGDAERQSIINGGLGFFEEGPAFEAWT